MATTEKTRNEGYGFWGTVSIEKPDEVEKFWALAIQAVADAAAVDAPMARRFLDSGHGRHFADAVLDRYETDALAAIRDAILFLDFNHSRRTGPRSGNFRRMVRRMGSYED